MIWLECWINRQIVLEFPYEQVAVALHIDLNIRKEPYDRFLFADCANKQIISTAGNDNSQGILLNAKTGKLLSL